MTDRTARPPTTDRREPGLAENGDRSRTEQQAALLWEISRELVGLDTIATTMEHLGELIGRHFDVTQCMFWELVDSGETAAVSYAWNRDDARPLIGADRMRDFMSEELVQANNAGDLSIVCDTQHDPRVSAETCGALGIRSFFIVPMSRDGKWRFLSSIIDGRVREWRDDEIALLREITDRIWLRLQRARAEGALRESEEKYRTLFQSMGQGYADIELVRDADGRAIDQIYHEFNPAFERLIGIPLASAKGRRASEVLPALEPWWHEAFDRIAKQGEHERIEYEVASLGRWFEVFAYPQGGDHLTVLYEDVTQRKLAEEALQRSAKDLRSIANVVPDLLWSSEPDGTTTWYNERWMEYTGQTREGAIGWGWMDAIHPDDREISARRYGEAIAGRRSLRQEYRIRRYDGEYRWFLIRAEPLEGAEGLVVRMYSAASDIHNERIARQQFEDFFRSVSHDLQTPLTSIRAGLGLLEAGSAERLGDAERDLLAAARRNTERLRMQIARLLAASHVEGTPQVEQADIEVVDVVQSALEMIRPLMDQKDQVLHPDLPESLIVRGDRSLLDGVLANLLSNAHRHTPPGTRITVSGWFAGDEVHLAVHDTGPGIAPDQIEAIFQRFHRGASTSVEGMGLGLAIVKSAVEAQGGRVWAESMPRKGTTFFVVLPRGEPSDSNEPLHRSGNTRGHHDGVET